VVTTPIGTSDDVGKKVLVQADGKIVVAGYSVGSPTGLDFAVVRYNANGTLDKTFGIDGRVTTDLGSIDEGGWSAALQDDGKIVVAGRRFNGVNDNIVVIRYNTDGSLDTSFGNGGSTIYDGGTPDQALGVAIRPDGQIIVVGSSLYLGDTDIFHVRFDASGNLVDSAMFDYSGLNDVGNSVAVQSDGKYLVAGYVTFTDGFKYVSLIRYGADGLLDATFGSSGSVITAVGISDDVAQSVLVQPDGKIIVAGFTVDNGTGRDFLTMRYNQDGTLDSTFGLSGVTSTDLGSLDEVAWGSALQTDGKIILVGSRLNGLNDDLVLIRYNSDGSIDTTFGNAGSAITPAVSGAGFSWSIALQSDGGIIVTGSSSNGLNQDITTLRFNTNGTIDDTFGGPVIGNNGQVIGRPIITSNGGGATASVSVSENSTEVASVTGTDPNAGTALIYSIVGGADYAKFRINESTGILTFINAPDFEAPTDIGANNVYDVVVRVTNGTLTDTQTLAVTVTNQTPETVIGTTRDDTFVASNDIEAFNGLPGSDTVDYRAASKGISASLAIPSQNTGAAAGDTYVSIENLIGSSFNDKLTGDADANVLTGGAGVDTLAGGTGNDTYNVNLTAAGKLEDKVVETSKLPGEVDRIVLSGTSTNAATVTLKLGANIEDLDASLTGSSRLNITGNALANNITGNDWGNVITGAGGADTMDGRDGGDIYVVTSAADFNGDTISDTGSSGVDEFRFAGKSAATLYLNAVGLERVTIGTGNGLDAITKGKGAVNINASGVANGLEMIGNNGHNALTGTGFNDVLRGNSGNDSLDGGAGNDDLYGGLGNDILTGGSGMDSFIFNTTPNTTKNWDTITDFNVADDTIELDHAVFAALGTATGTLSAGAFVIGAAALDAADRVIYNSDTGALFYDSDGNAAGGSVQIATLATGLALTNNDFLII